MQRTTFLFLMIGLFGAFGTQAIAANMQSKISDSMGTRDNSSLAYCDHLYDGVAKANCVQQFNAGWSKADLNMDRAAAKPEQAGVTNQHQGVMENCNALYGVSKTNCLQEYSRVN